MRAMKDSGIEWIGEIPEEWGTIKIKYIATLNGRIGWQGLTSAEYCDEGAYLITGINFENGGINWDTCVHVPMSRWEEAEQIQISEGDLLITKDGTVGKTAIVKNMPGETSLNSGVLLISTNSSCNKGYLYWVLNSEIFWKWFNEINAGNSTIIHLYQYDFKEFSFPLPSLDIQQRIASYFDSKCSKIDNIIAKQQQLIEKLKEYKQAVITEAVTKGLNPDVPMKDSGIEWIGKIPEHWMITRLKNEVLNLDSLREPISAENRINQQGLYDYYGASGIIDKIDDYNVDDKVLLIGEDGANLVMRNLPLIYKAEGRFWVNNHAHILKVNSDNDYDYMALLLEAGDYTRVVTGSAQPKLSQSNLMGFKIIKPSKEEQIRISEYLYGKCNGIDNAIYHRQNLITKLQEYKKSLIYEVVTGKRDVPNG